MKKLIKTISVIACTLIVISGCGKSPEEQFNDSLKDFSNSKDRDVTSLGTAFFEAFGIKKDRDEILYINKKLILSGSGKIEITFPEKIKLDTDGSVKDNIEFADIGGEYIVLGNSSGFCVFNKKGDPLSIFKSPNKEKINALATEGKRIIFASNHTLYDYNPGNENKSKLAEGTFPPPYKKYFRSKLEVNEKYAVLISGIAGSYYISAVDIDKGTIIIKDISASSLEFAISQNKLYCIKGASGKWSIVKYDLTNKSSDTVASLNKIDNVFLSSQGYITCTSGSVEVSDYTGTAAKIPFECSVSGICRDDALILFNKNNYLIDLLTLYKKMTEISSIKAENNI